MKKYMLGFLLLGIVGCKETYRGSVSLTENIELQATKGSVLVEAGEFTGKLSVNSKVVAFELKNKNGKKVKVEVKDLANMKNRVSQKEFVLTAEELKQDFSIHGVSSQRSESTFCDETTYYKLELELLNDSKKVIGHASLVKVVSLYTCQNDIIFPYIDHKI